MKRLTLIVTLLLMVVMPMMAERVSPETARKVATTFLNNNGAKSNQLVDLSKTAGFSNLYILSTEESFVIMAADDRVKPILGYSLTGKFVAEEMPENLVGWLQGYNDEIQYASDHRMSADAETAQLWKDLIEGNSKAAKATPVVSNLLSTTWDQRPLYNNYCPYDTNAGELTVTGCVATAMAQIMRYWGYPAHGIGSHSYHLTLYGTLTADFGNTTYDWENMPSSLLSGSPTAEQIHEVAQLMYHCGVSVEMEYNIASNGGSGAATAFVADALQRYFNYQSCTFKYKADNEDNWVNMLKTELDAGRPLQYSGRGSAGGHSFVCCGYDSDDNFYYNWGWSGQNDGFYALDNLVPGSGGAGGGSYSFTENQGAIFGIHPSNNNNAPSNLTYVMEGLQDLTLSWTAATGAASYNVYCDNDLIANATTNSYTTTAPYGIHSYYVRSVDAEGELSLSSNTVTITIDYQTPVVDDLEAELSGSDVLLNWTAPAWCYPETPTAILTYGNGSMDGYTTSKYWAHRYLAADLAPYSNKAIYKISFYVFNATGTYNCFVYKGANMTSYSGDDIYSPETLLMSKSVEVSKMNCWIEVDFDDLVLIDGSDEIWVVINYPDNGNGTIACLYSIYSDSNNQGGYWGKWTIDGEPGFVLNGDIAFLIRTYLTDGTYTYNLYQDGTAVVENLNSTTYNASLNNNAANLFTVKTNYYAGETDASNKVGFAKGSATINDWEMASNDKMTLTEGSTLTVSGNLVNTDPDNLILENGARLIHNSEDVHATVKKAIEPYTANDNGWHFIASPVTETITPSEENGFLNGTVGQDNNTYDLYYYYEPEYLWMNYETETFNLVHQQGYLYANGENNGTTLQFAGTLTPSNNSVTINDLSHSSTILNGFNLVGNPFVCNATVDKDFYVIDNTTNEVVLAEQNAVIAPCEGVFVQASENNTSVTFSKANAAKGNNAKDCFDIVVTQGKANIDRARVHLGEGNGMEKFSLDDKHTQISLWQDGQQFAVAYTNGQSELPLNFKATRNDTYTLNIEAGDHELNYLHLIDNLTGDDVNLLATPSYTFEAKTTDYASRFRLVFSNCEDAVGDNETFAYVNNEKIIVTADVCDASLQVVDMMGHVILCTDVARNVSTHGMSAGVYVLRLITAEGMRTQKIIIE